MSDKSNSFAQGESGFIQDVHDSEWIPIIDWSSVYPGNRGVNRKMMYDLYDAPIGVKLQIEEAVKSEPLLVSDQEWEGYGALYPVKIWKSGDGYSMLYMAYPASSEPWYAFAPGPAETRAGGMGFAHSNDGYHWIRPTLGQVAFNGSYDNNMVANALQGVPFEDPVGIPEERFKAMGQEGGCYDPDTGERLEAQEAYMRYTAMEYNGNEYKGPRMVSKHWISGWTSPDAIHWTKIEKPLANVASDGGNAAQYDREADTYFAYIRVKGMERRATGLARTKNFWEWPLAELVLAPDPQDPPEDSFYWADYFSYPGCKNIHGMFLMVYHQISDKCDSQIAFSRDRTHWQRPERRPILAVGPADSKESCIVNTCGGLVELPDGNWVSAYRSAFWLHNSRGVMPQGPTEIRWAIWKPYRFCGIDAETEGRFTIPTLERKKSELRLNYRCKPGGWICVELIREIPSRLHPDVDGIKGYTFNECDRLLGDSLSEVVSWNGISDISVVGETVAIRIRMFASKIYAYNV